MNNEKTLLVYGLEKAELDFFSMSNIKYKIITEDMGSCVIENILNDNSCLGSKVSLPREKVILINGFEEDEVGAMVRIIRATMGKDPILAVITKTSITWTLQYLLKHLIEERQWYKNNSSK